MNTTSSNLPRAIAPNGANDGLAIDPSLIDAVANQVLASLKPSGSANVSKGASSGPASSATAWSIFSQGIDALTKANPDLVHALEASVAKSARHVLADLDMAVPSADEFLKMISTTSKGSVQGSWWGIQFYLSHQDIQSFVPGATGVVAIGAALGSAVAGSYAPFVAAAAAFVLGALALIKQLDHGRGVFISMSWFAVGAFVPTTA